MTMLLQNPHHLKCILHITKLLRKNNNISIRHPYKRIIIIENKRPFCKFWQTGSSLLEHNFKIFHKPKMFFLPIESEEDNLEEIVSISHRFRTGWRHPQELDVVVSYPLYYLLLYDAIGLILVKEKPPEHVLNKPKYTFNTNIYPFN